MKQLLEPLLVLFGAFAAVVVDPAYGVFTRERDQFETDGAVDVPPAPRQVLFVVAGTEAGAEELLLET
jgi:hypothetical protein